MSRRRNWAASAILIALAVAVGSWRLYRVGEEHRRAEERRARELRELQDKIRELDTPPKGRPPEAPGGKEKQ